MRWFAALRFSSTPGGSSTQHTSLFAVLSDHESRRLCEEDEADQTALFWSAE